MIMGSNGEKEPIDEKRLMEMMAGKREADPLARARAGISVGAAAKAPPREVAKEQPKDTYLELFFSEAASNARNGKSVYIRPEYHERLTRIVQVIGGDRISLYSYLDNVLSHHFSEFAQEITRNFDDSYKPIL